MTLDEIRTIREKQSLETIGMTSEQLHTYFSKGADCLEKMIEEKRKMKNSIEEMNKNVSEVGIFSP